MQPIKINPRGEQSAAKFALFELGFRPFFLCAAASAVAYMGLWLAVYVWGLSLKLPYSAAVWHQHEMLFGYTVAVIAGFLLTAVQNWTGRSTPKGVPLALLVGVWLVGRIAPWLAFPPWLAALSDVVFLPLLAIVLAAPILRRKQWHNCLIPAMLLGMALANVGVHAAALGLKAPQVDGHQLMLGLVVALIIVLAGRLIPFFTRRAYGGVEPPQHKVLGGILHGAVAGFILTKALFPETWLLGVFSLLAAGALGWRLLGWYAASIWSEPLLWALHVGCAWIVVGFGLQALVSAGLLAVPLAVHAFTAGGIGVVTLGMMVRVSLGHTSRPMRASKPMTFAFILINAAAFSRVILPLLIPNQYVNVMVFFGGLWMAAFGLFVWKFTPILIGLRKNTEGLPG